MRVLTALCARGRRPALGSWMAVALSVGLTALAGAALAESEGMNELTTRPAKVERVGVFVELRDRPAAQVYAEAIGEKARPDAATRLRANNLARRQVLTSGEAQARLAAALQAIPHAELYRAQRVLNGIAILVAPDRIAELSRLPGVKSVHLLQPQYPTNSESVPFIGAPAVWENTLGLSMPAKGEGISIGIIDSGIDYMHANFGGTGLLPDYQAAAAATSHWTTLGGVFPTPKVVGGYDFVGDAYNGSNTPVPDPNPMDCNGHGSHVAGTAAGRGVTSAGTTYPGPYDTTTPFGSLRIGPGVAPKADLYALRVFGCGGWTNMVPAALDWATDPNGDGDFSDHLDVIDISLGNSFGDPASSDAEAAQNAARVGAIVVASAGNSGDTYFIHDTFASAPLAISAAASIDNGFFTGVLPINAPPAIAGSYPAGIGIFTPRSQIPSVQGGNAVLVDDGVAGGTTSDGCESPFVNQAQVAGNVALMDRGPCAFIKQVANAQAAGAIGAIIANNVDDPVPFNMFGSGSTITIQSLFVTLATGNAIKSQLPSPGVNVNLYFAGGGDTILFYSSRGPTRSSFSGTAASLKPDIAAPGIDITSTQTGVTCTGTTSTGCITSDPSGYLPNSPSSTMQGTSMAAAHVAGVGALLRQLHPDWSVEEIKALMMNGALHDVTVGANGTGAKFGPGRVGAGRTDAAASAPEDVIAFSADDPGQVSLSFSLEVVGTASQTRHIRVLNHGSSAATFDLAVVTTVNAPGVSLSLPGGSTVGVPAGGQATVDVRLDADAAQMDHTREATVAGTQLFPSPLGAFGNRPRHWLTEGGGYVTFSSGGQVKLRVPFYALARPASTMAGGSIATGGNPTGSTTVALSGTGVCTGTLGAGPACTGTPPTDVVSRVSPFELQVISPPNPDAASFEDLQYAGVAYDPVADVILFGVSTWGEWASPTLTPVNVWIDNNSDGVFDRILFNSNAGTIAASLLGTPVGPNDVFTNAVIDPSTFSLAIGGPGLFTNVAPASAVDSGLFNRNVMILAATPAQLGLPAGTTSFRYRIDTCPQWAPVCGAGSNPFFIDRAAGPYTWDYAAANQGLNFGGRRLFPDLDGASIPVTFDTTRLAANGSLGALLLHHHNVEGQRAQVLLVEGSPSTDLALSGSTSSTTPEVGTQVTLTTQVSNLGPGAASGVKVQLGAAGNFGYVSDDGGGALDLDTAIWTVGSLAAGASATLHVVLRIDGTGLVTFFGFMAGSTPLDPNPANDRVTLSMQPQTLADLSLTKTGAPDPVLADAPITYTLTVGNAGPDMATVLVVTDTLPPGTTFVSATGTDWNCAHAAGMVTCQRASLGSGLSSAVTIVANAPATSGTLTNTATVAATQADPDTTNNTASDSTTVQEPPLSFYTVAPCRVADTRNTPNGPLAGPPLAAGAVRVFPVTTSPCGIPSSAKAISVNVTVTGASVQGNLRLFPAGPTTPGTSTINYSAGVTRANNSIVSLNAAGELAVYCAQAGGTTAHVILDVNGYFR
jgi:uncharacterized repeat protein (TIGR01451 family)